MAYSFRHQAGYMVHFLDPFFAHVCNCGICDEVGEWKNAVGWYEGPVEQDPGERVPEFGPDAIAGGKMVCRACHDKFYGIVPPEPVDPRQIDLFQDTA